MKQQIKQHLKQLENNMRSLDWWQSIPPIAEQLSSQQPFALDTLTPCEWLQWIFIPRMYAMLERDTYPQKIAITPYIEESMKEENHIDQLLLPLRNIEQLLTQDSVDESSE